LISSYQEAQDFIAMIKIMTASEHLSTVDDSFGKNIIVNGSDGRFLL